MAITTAGDDQPAEWVDFEWQSDSRGESGYDATDGPGGRGREADLACGTGHEQAAGLENAAVEPRSQSSDSCHVEHVEAGANHVHGNPLRARSAQSIEHPATIAATSSPMSHVRRPAGSMAD
jgi:hypothetical protein